MAATNFTSIVIYNTATGAAVPLAANMLQGELAVNVTDKKLFTKDSVGNVVLVGVDLTTSQTLTNKTLTGYTETVYALAGTDIAPANGTVQTKTLAANTTFTESLADGQSLVLMLNPATYTTTWPTTSWVKADGSATAPTLKASVVNVIVLWQVAGVLYGNFIGSM